MSGTAVARWLREFLCVLFALRDPTVPPAKPVVEVKFDSPKRKP